VSDYIVSVDGRRFTELEPLYSHLNELPEDAVVEIILKRVSGAQEFYREYRRITLSRSKLEWVKIK
jgi:hypothetical protein